jgi:hypothetical protein
MMKRVAWAVALGIIVAVGVFSLSPAVIMVGDASITLKESKVRVLIGNAIGDFRGNLRCQVTGLSFYWTPVTPLRYENAPDGGANFSSYAVEALLQMDEEKGYQIAQHGFGELQNKYWSKKGNRLIRPLTKL